MRAYTATKLMYVVRSYLSSHKSKKLIQIKKMNNTGNTFTAKVNATTITSILKDFTDSTQSLHNFTNPI